MSNLPPSGQGNSLDNVAVTREEFRVAIGEVLQFLAQSLGGVAGTYTTEAVDPVRAILQGQPALKAGSAPPPDDSSGRIPSTAWVRSLLADPATGFLPLAGGTLTGNVGNSGTGFLRLPVGTTTQRPATGLDGMLRHNSSLGRLEAFGAGSWGAVGAGVNSGVFRNRLDNGDFVISQRHSSTAHALTNQTKSLCDRWLASFSDTTLWCQRRDSVADGPPGFGYQAVITVATPRVGAPAGSTALVGQGIEVANLRDVQWGRSGAQAVTLTFKVNSSIPGRYGGSLRLGPGTGPFYSYPFAYTIALPNTWEDITIVIPPQTTFELSNVTDLGACLILDLGSGATYQGTVDTWQSGNRITTAGCVQWVNTLGATFAFTAAQLEVGNAATPYAWLDVTAIFNRCQRYFQAGVANAIYNGSASSATISGEIYFPAVMRDVPAIDGIPNASYATAWGFSRFETVAANTWARETLYYASAEFFGGF